MTGERKQALLKDAADAAKCYRSSSPMGERKAYALTAALAYGFLAEHPADDDTPIDAEWLRAVWFIAKFKQFSKGELHLYEFDGPGDGWAAFRDWRIPYPSTRGAVRRLCAAVGIALEEPS